jgi:anti-anti-sigma factor
VPLKATVRIQPHSDTAVLTLRGVLDVYSALDVRRAILRLRQVPVQRVVLDLTALTFIDTIGAGALVQVVEPNGTFDPVVTIVARTHQVIAMLRVVGLAEPTTLVLTSEDPVSA